MIRICIYKTCIGEFYCYNYILIGFLLAPCYINLHNIAFQMCPHLLNSNILNYYTNSRSSLLLQRYELINMYSRQDLPHLNEQFPEKGTCTKSRFVCLLWCVHPKRSTMNIYTTLWTEPLSMALCIRWTRTRIFFGRTPTGVTGVQNHLVNMVLELLAPTWHINLSEDCIETSDPLFGHIYPYRPNLTI